MAVGGFGGSTAVKSSVPTYKKNQAALGGWAQPAPAAPAAAAPQWQSFAMPATTPVPTTPSAPPEIQNLQITAEADPRLSRYAEKYDTHLGKLEAGTTREADVFRGQMDSDMERQIAQAKESALAAGRPWTAQDEERMRSELKRGQYGAMAEFELGSQRQMTEALQGGLPIESSPFQSQLAEKGVSQGTQKMLMDYALGRGGLISEDKKTAVAESGLAIDAYKAFLQMLGGNGAFSFNTSYGG